MAKLSFIEKDCFERLFGMENGYVLDFMNIPLKKCSLSGLFEHTFPVI